MAHNQQIIQQIANLVQAMQAQVALEHPNSLVREVNLVRIESFHIYIRLLQGLQIN